MPSKFVTQTEKDAMVEAYLGGATAEEAGALLGYSEKPAYTALSQAGVARRPSGSRNSLTEQQQNEIIADYLTGLTLEQVGERYDRKPTTIISVLERHNIPRRKGAGRPKRTPESTRQAMADAYVQGRSTCAIAKEFNTDSGFVSVILKEKGIKARKLDRLTPDQKQETARRYQAGANPSTIAQDFGVTSGTIIKAITSTGTQLRTISEANQKRIAPSHLFTTADVVTRGKVRRLCPSGVAKACLLYLAGHGAHIIARHLGVHKNAIRCLIDSRNLQPRQGEISPESALNAIQNIVSTEDAEGAAGAFDFPLEVERAHIFSAAQEEEICVRYAAGEGCVLLGKSYGTSEGAILAALRRNGVEPRNGKLTEEQLAKIVSRYQNGERLRHLGQEFGLAHGNIRALMTKRGIERKPAGESNRLYDCNHYFFDNITTQEQAYWLGFIAADGCVTRAGELKIQLADKDSEMLYQLLAALESNHKVRHFHRTHRSGEGDYCSISISSPLMVEHLAKWGIVPAKTFTCPWPPLPLPLQRHYLRGYFDGDGGWSVTGPDRRTPQVKFSIIGPEHFLIEAQNYLIDECQLLKTTLTKSSCFGLRNLNYGGNKQAARIARLMYDDATIYLSRKYDKVKHLL